MVNLYIAAMPLNTKWKYENVMAYVIKNLFFFSVVNVDKLFYKQATSYSLFEPSHAQLDQSEPSLITIGFELLRVDCKWS